MSNYNPQALALNEIIENSNSSVLNMLSDKGKGAYFPSKGILAQSADAKGKKINATIGIALEDDGAPMGLNSVMSQFTLDSKDSLPYAPSPGKPEFRKVWKDMIFVKNPSLSGIEISNPVVTSALTHALSICAYMFLDNDDKIICTDLFWGNYSLMFENAYGAKIDKFNTFKDGGFDIDALANKLEDGIIGKKVLILNFPNNPTGYTPTEIEIDKIVKVISDSADKGNEIVVLVDDAYFGLVFLDGIYKESIFAKLSNLSSKVLAVKVDGATKEDYVWGFRVGFITYGIKGGNSKLYKALESKTSGAIRGNISNSPHLSQSLLLNAFTSSSYASEKKEKFNTLKKRFDKVNEILITKKEYKQYFSALPFNSGYFMCLDLLGVNPENVRQVLLKDFSTGVVVAQGVMRIAFSATPINLLDELFENIYEAIKIVKA